MVTSTVAVQAVTTTALPTTTTSTGATTTSTGATTTTATSPTNLPIPIVFPLESRVPVTRSFMVPRSGHLHQGIDLLARKMTKEVAVVSGTVVLQVRTWHGRPWYTLWLKGDDGHGYYYSHINNDTPGTDDGKGGLKYAFAPGLVTGSNVRQGQFIAYCGDSGNAETSSPHLHFEIHETTSVFSPSVDPYDSLYGATLADGTPPPARPVPRLTRYEQTNPKITYTGPWSGVTSAGASGRSYTNTDSNAGALVWFEGTRLDLLATKAADQGEAWLSLDGGPPVSVDLHSPTTLHKQMVWSTGPLAHGTHTVRVVWAGRATVAGGGTRVNIDALDVTGYLLQTPILASSQESNGLLAYEGAWRTSSTGFASGSRFRSADSAGASVTVQFTGIYAAWIAKTSPASGKAKLTLDGGDPVMVDLYSESTLYQQKAWNSGVIGYGIHVLKIEWTGVKSQEASGTSINLDALQLMGRLDSVGAVPWTGPAAGTTIQPPLSR